MVGGNASTIVSSLRDLALRISLSLEDTIRLHQPQLPSGSTGITKWRDSETDFKIRRTDFNNNK